MELATYDIPAPYIYLDQVHHTLKEPDTARSNFYRKG